MAARDDGFLDARIQTNLLNDPKMRRLEHLAGDEAPACALVYLQTVLASWNEGRQLTAMESEAMVPATPERVAFLVKVKLLDGAGRIPSHAWERHFGPAWTARQKRRTANLSGVAKAKDGEPEAAADPPGDPDGTHEGEAARKLREQMAELARSKALNGSRTQEATQEAPHEGANGVAIVTPDRPSVRPSDPGGSTDGQASSTSLSDPPGEPPDTHEAPHMGEDEHEDEPDWQAIQERWRREQGTA